jgi:predicted nucleic acid-binding protein
MLVYLDSSVLARAYLADEDGHAQARRLLEDPGVGLITSSLTRVEVSGALVRAGRAGRVDAVPLLDVLDADLDVTGLVALVSPPYEDVEAAALTIVRKHGLRALDSWHLAVASIAGPTLADGDEVVAFASRDSEQAAVAVALGLTAL